MSDWRTLHSFGTAKQASYILAVLSRIGETGGKQSLRLTFCDVSSKPGRPVHKLEFSPTKWAEAYARLVKRPALASEILSDTNDVERKCSMLSGMVRGLVYAQGGTK